MLTPDVFYMVFINGRNTPTNRHAKLDDAVMELRRLSAKENAVGFVLKSVVRSVPTVLVETVPMDGID